MFHILLSFALSAALNVIPTASITSGVVIATCFAPEENCTAFAVDAVNGAEREILVGAYSLTVGSGIPEGAGQRVNRLST